MAECNFAFTLVIVERVCDSGTVPIIIQRHEAHHRYIGHEPKWLTSRCATTVHSAVERLAAKKRYNECVYIDAMLLNYIV